MYTDGGASREQREADPTFDAFIVAWCMLTGLLPLFVKSFTGIFFIAIPVIFAYLRYERIMPMLSRTWPLLAIGGWAVLSAFWSPYPGETVYYGLQLGLTIFAACIIGAATDPRQTVNGMFYAFLIHGIAVFTYGLGQGDLFPIDFDGFPFVGLAGSKNTTADMAALGVLAALAMLVQGLREVRPVAVVLSLFLIGLDVIIIVAARSAGAYAALTLAVVFFIGWAITSSWPIVARTAIMMSAAVFAIIAAITRNQWFPVVFERYLQMSGKDEGLTGRDYIWSRAEVLVSQRPWFGRGFASFWIEGDLEPTAIWDTMYVANHVGFNFHSSVYELLVYFGYVGLVGVVAIFGFYILLLARRLVLEPHPITILFASLIAYDGLRFSFEALPLGIFAHNTLFLYGALSHAVGLEFFGRKRPRRAHIPRPQPVYVRRAAKVRTSPSH